jgi:proteasome lid subunit RPN8/RPN11
MTTAIVLTNDQLTQLANIAKSALPNESCAFLLGDGNELEVTEVMPMNNSDKSAYSFTIAPDDVLAAYRNAESKGLQVMGIFHSHPGKPFPSSTDKKFMELNPIVWLIYSTTENRFEAHLLGNTPENIEIKIRE